MLGRPTLKATELHEFSDEELRQRIRERVEDLVRFRLQVSTGTVDNVRAARNTRRDIARLKTVLRQRELAAAKQHDVAESGREA